MVAEHVAVSNSTASQSSQRVVFHAMVEPDEELVWWRRRRKRERKTRHRGDEKKREENVTRFETFHSPALQALSSTPFLHSHRSTTRTTTTTMPHDLYILHFRVPDHIPTTPSTQGQAAPAGTAAKDGTHEWMCQLSILEDKSTIRGTLGPLPASEVNRTELQPCCTLQITSVREYEPHGMQVVLNKRVKSEDLFKRGIECKIYNLCDMDVETMCNRAK